MRQLEMLGEALFDFQTPADLKIWLDKAEAESAELSSN